MTLSNTGKIKGFSNVGINESTHKNMCEQCGMTETLCECWMKEEVEGDLQESFKQEKEKITEMFNRFKKYN